MSRSDEVLQAAFDLLDEVGLDALTTRRLAQKLNMRPSALYRHFESKRALLTAMVTHLMVGDQPPPTEHDWSEQVGAAARWARTTMLTRRDGARLVTTYLQPNQASTQIWESFLNTMRAAGLTDYNAAVAIDTIFAYTNGFTIEEQARDGFPQPAEQRSWRDSVFTSGLDVIISGIRARLLCEDH